MKYMFNDCSSLISINLSSFNTELVTDMSYMFNKCSSLTSLNLSNFNTSLVKYMQNMFQDCLSLEYINIENFNDKNLLDAYKIFDNVPNNVAICYEKSGTLLTKIQEAIECFIINCSNDWKLYQKKIVNKTGICFDKQKKDIFFKYEYNGSYYEQCSNGNLIKIKNGHKINSCICELLSD